MPSPVIISATGAFLGLILFFFAWRGRRIDDHPLCRRCGFDLIGRPLDADKCSECGAHLNRRRAIRVGHRRVRGGWLLAALVLILANTGWLTVIARQYATTHDLTAYKPTWWLLSDARGTSAKRDPAFSRLLQRLSEKKLNSSQTHAVIGLILAAQADPKRPWNKDWGRIIEDLREQHIVSDDQWHTYWRQAMSLRVYLFREEVSMGDELSGLLLFTIPPKDSGRYRVDRPTLVTAAIGNSSLSIRKDALVSMGSIRLKLPLNEVVADLPDGPQTLRATVKIARTAPASPSWVGLFTKERELDPLMIPIEAKFTLLPPEQPTVVLNKNPEIELQLIQCFQLEPITLKRRKGTLEQIACSKIIIMRPPVDVAFNVFISQKGLEWPLGHISCATGHKQECHLQAPADGLQEMEARLTLRPDFTAPTNAQIRKLWGNAIEIEKVPVKGP